MSDLDSEKGLFSSWGGQPLPSCVPMFRSALFSLYPGNVETSHFYTEQPFQGVK